MKTKSLDDLIIEGQKLLLGSKDPYYVQEQYEKWVKDVSQQIASEFPNTGLLAEWLSFDNSILVTSRGYNDSTTVWLHHRKCVQDRMKWLSGLPLLKAKIMSGNPGAVQESAVEEGRREVKVHAIGRAFVNPSRIEELRDTHIKSFDLTRLIRLCEELNICYASECYHAVAMIERAIIDHIPPLFNCSVFSEVSSKYKGAGSFKESMRNLNNSARKIADAHLHIRVRASEVLPNATQVDFSNDLDVLLGEIVRIGKKI